MLKLKCCTWQKRTSIQVLHLKRIAYVATPESHAGMDQNCRWRSVGMCLFLHSLSESETMQERRGDGTEAKLCNLFNQLEELLLLIQEGPKVITSQPRSPQAGAEVQASSEGRNEYYTPGNESENVETRDVSKEAGDLSKTSGYAMAVMARAWLETDGATLRLRRSSDKGVRACPKAPAMPPSWPKSHLMRIYQQQ